jgi:nucleoside-diphosphate-sugar epimerase
MVQYCLDRGAEVCSIDIATPRNPSHVPQHRSVDIRDEAEVRHVIEDYAPHYLIHLAARTDLDQRATLDDYDSNTRGVASLLVASKTCSSLRRAVFASSMLVCAFGYVPRDDYDYQPSTVYGESKIETERLVRSYPLPFPWTLVRPTSIWGPWFGPPYRAFFEYVLSGKFVDPGRRAGTATYGFVGNTVDQIARVLEAPAHKVHERVFYLGDSPPLNLSAWARRIAQLAVCRPPITVPYGFLKAASVSGDLLGRLGVPFPLTSFRLNNLTTNNILDLRVLCDVAPDPPYPLDEGIRKTVLWLERHRGE